MVPPASLLPEDRFPLLFSSLSVGMSACSAHGAHYMTATRGILPTQQTSSGFETVRERTPLLVEEKRLFGAPGAIGFSPHSTVATARNYVFAFIMEIYKHRPRLR